jgi:hypothetical protein
MSGLSEQNRTLSLPFTSEQEWALEVTERVASALSIIGCVFIVATFLSSKTFRKPANRLIFYASLGNLAMNVGTALSLDGIRAGRNSALCQFQGFLIQMFLPADAFWNLSMAINVYLTVFRNYDAKQLKRNDWIYLMVNYGLTFVVAFVYCFVGTGARGKMYGPATLWCWVDKQWDDFRVILVYAPAWYVARIVWLDPANGRRIAIAAAFTIYMIAGREIFRKRRELRAFRDNGHAGGQDNTFHAFKTTEVQVTSEVADYAVERGEVARESRTSINLDPQSRSMNTHGLQQYSVSVSRGPRFINPFAAGSYETSPEYKANNVALEANKAAWGYTKCALLFFVSLLITWLPSSIFRVHSLIHDSPGYFPLAYATGLVLPLMGFWNTVIYITTSWDAVNMLFGELRPRRVLVAFGLPGRAGGRRQGPRSRDPWAGTRGQSLSDGGAFPGRSRGTSKNEYAIRDDRGSLSDSLKGLAQ